MAYISLTSCIQNDAHQEFNVHYSKGHPEKKEDFFEIPEIPDLPDQRLGYFRYIRPSSKRLWKADRVFPFWPHPKSTLYDEKTSSYHQFGDLRSCIASQIELILISKIQQQDARARISIDRKRSVSPGRLNMFCNYGVKIFPNSFPVNKYRNMIEKYLEKQD